MATSGDLGELARRCAAQRTRVQSLAQAGLHEQACAAVLETVTLVGRVRAEAPSGSAEPVKQAEHMFRLVAELTRIEAVSYLPALPRVLAEFGRCCRQAGQYERAAGMFGSAVDAVKIQLASRRAGGREADILACELELMELMSSHALALAQAGMLAQAYDLASEFVEIARGRLPHSLPLLTGGLAFMADLADDLGRPREGVEHLIEGVRVLGVGAADGLPGADAAGARLASRLRDAAAAVEFELPEDVASMLTKLAPT
jgi:hypothetical protein